MVLYSPSITGFNLCCTADQLEGVGAQNLHEEYAPRQILSRQQYAWEQSHNSSDDIGKAVAVHMARTGYELRSHWRFSQFRTRKKLDMWVFTELRDWEGNSLNIGSVDVNRNGWCHQWGTKMHSNPLESSLSEAMQLEAPGPSLQPHREYL